MRYWVYREVPARDKEGKELGDGFIPNLTRLLASPTEAESPEKAAEFGYVAQYGVPSGETWRIWVFPADTATQIEVSKSAKVNIDAKRVTELW